MIINLWIGMGYEIFMPKRRPKTRGFHQSKSIQPGIWAHQNEDSTNQNVGSVQKNGKLTANNDHSIEKKGDSTKNDESTSDQWEIN